MLLSACACPTFNNESRGNAIKPGTRVIEPMKAATNTPIHPDSLLPTLKFVQVECVSAIPIMTSIVKDEVEYFRMICLLQ